MSSQLETVTLDVIIIGDLIWATEVLLKDPQLSDTDRKRLTQAQRIARRELELALPLPGLLANS